MGMSEESAAWIEDRFLDWQKDKGRASLAKFADWLGISPNSLNNWISRKQTPTGDSAMRAGVQALVADPTWLEWPPERLRPVLLRAFPALYVNAGALCPPPE